jgi:cytochrome c-type biogenesis protein CcmH/NrfF
VPVASYLENGILTWGVPLLVLVAVCVYWALVARRHGER